MQARQFGMGFAILSGVGDRPTRDPGERPILNLVT
jgi:hypothetical protein